MTNHEELKKGVKRRNLGALYMLISQPCSVSQLLHSLFLCAIVKQPYDFCSQGKFMPDFSLVPTFSSHRFMC